jgi:hypothetical protein
VARVVERLRERHAHEAGAARDAVEPRVVHHREDRAHAAILGPDARAQVPRYSISLDAFERLPSLSLSRWMWNGLRVPSGRQRGTRKQVGRRAGLVFASVSSASLIGAE